MERHADRPQLIERLPNGLTLLAEPHPQAQTVAFSLQLPLGSVRDPEGLCGLSHLTQDLLFKGAGPWDARALATEIDRIGLQEDHRAERELITFSGTALPQNLPSAVEVLTAVVREPHLPPAGLEEVRQLSLHRLRALDDAPMQKMFYELGQRFFPPPLSHPAEGRLDTLPAITLEDARRFWARYSPRGAVLAVAGAFDPDALTERLERRLSAWQGPEPEPVPLGRSARSVEHLPQDTEQTQIGVAYDSVPYSHPDYLKARMGVLALSGGMSARLFVEVRQKRGLAYSVFATHVTTKDFGGVLAYAGTTPERAQETLTVLLAELRRVREGITAEEFDKAKTRLKTDYIVQGESTRARAESLAREFYYCGRARSLDEVLGEIDRLSLEAVNAFLRDSVPREFLIMTLGRQSLEVTP